MKSKHTRPEFVQKILSKEGLKFYLSEKNINKHNDMGLEDMNYLLKPVEYKNLDVEIGVLRFKDIEAGSSFSVPVEVTKENSIICVNFQTVDYDIMIGLYKA